MAQIIQKPPTFGETFGTGLGSGLHQLVQSKLQQISERNKISQGARLWENAGLPKQTAYAIASQPESIQKSLLDRLEGLSFGGQQQNERTQNQLQQLMSQQQQFDQMAQQEFQPQRQPSLLDVLQKISPLYSSMQQQSPAAQAQPEQKIIEAQQELPTPLAPTKKPGVTLGPPSQERRHREALELKKEALALKKQETQTKVSAKEQQEINKETLPTYTETTKAAKNANENDKLLNRMDELVNRGKLGSPAVNSALKTIAHGIFGFGIDLTSLMNADAQEFDKLSAQFIKGAKDLFPGRVTDIDLKAFMKQIPNLSQSAAGMKRVINGMKIANESARVRKNAMDEIIEENNGRRPANLDVLIERRVGKQLDQLSNDFINAPFVEESGRLAGSFYY